MSPCPVCWGKGKWPAISDSYWHKYGGTRGCDYIRSCPFCCGTALVKGEGRPAPPSASAAHDPLARLTALVTEAERAFAGQPKALWSDRTYLAPKDARVLRELIVELAERYKLARGIA